MITAGFKVTIIMASVSLTVYNQRGIIMTIQFIASVSLLGNLILIPRLFTERN